jgi:hypothetical protein
LGAEEALHVDRDDVVDHQLHVVGVKVDAAAERRVPFGTEPAEL